MGILRIAPRSAGRRPARGLGWCAHQIAVPRRRAPDAGSESHGTPASGGHATSIPQIRDRPTPREICPGLSVLPVMSRGANTGIVFLVGVLVPSSLRCSRRAGLTPSFRGRARHPHDGQPTLRNRQTITREEYAHEQMAGTLLCNALLAIKLCFMNSCVSLYSPSLLPQLPAYQPLGFLISLFINCVFHQPSLHE
jgi:hypothetical protein